jgi:uncharacterized protein with HEPN domain
MLDAAREAREFIHEKSREDLQRDRQLQHSLVRCIEIIGEAATRIDPEFRGSTLSACGTGSFTPISILS